MKRDSELSVVWHELEHLHEEVNQICNDMTKSATDAIQCDMIITVQLAKYFSPVTWSAD